MVEFLFMSWEKRILQISLMRVWEMNFVPNFKDRANTAGVHDYVIEFFTNPNSEWPQLFLLLLIQLLTYSGTYNLSRRKK